MDINIFSSGTSSGKVAARRYILTLLAAILANYILWTVETSLPGQSLWESFRTSFPIDLVTCGIEAAILMCACLAACRIVIGLFWKKRYSFGTILLQCMLLLMFIVGVSAVISFTYSRLYPDIPYLSWDVFLCDCLIGYFLTSIFFVSYLVNLYCNEVTVSLRTEVDKLKLKTDNHFVFNSFATLKTLIDTDRAAASDFCQSMSDTYRYIVGKGDCPVVELREELRFIDEYSRNISARHRNVSMEISAEPWTSALVIPPLTLQELVDNAIKHNVHTQESPLTIRIFFRENMLCVSNKIQPLQRRINSSGKGLETIRTRYRLLFGEEVAVTAEGGNFIVKLPLVNRETL